MLNFIISDKVQSWSFRPSFRAKI